LNLRINARIAVRLVRDRDQQVLDPDVLVRGGAASATAFSSSRTACRGVDICLTSLPA